MSALAPTFCLVNAKPQVARFVASAPMRTTRTRDLAEVYTYRRGACRMPRAPAPARAGFSCAVPPEHDAEQPRPRCTGRCPEPPVWPSWPNQPKRRPQPMVDRTGQIRFVRRTVTDPDVFQVMTELGHVHARTPEQTVLNLGRANPHPEIVPTPVRSSTRCGPNATRRSWSRSPAGSECRPL